MSKEGEFLKSWHKEAFRAGYDVGVDVAKRCIESLKPAAGWLEATGVETTPDRFYDQDTMTEDFEGWWDTQIEDGPIENWIPDCRQTKFLREWLMESYEMGYDTAVDAAGGIKDSVWERQFLQGVYGQGILQGVYGQDKMVKAFDAWWDTQIQDGTVDCWTNQEEAE